MEMREIRFDRMGDFHQVPALHLWRISHTPFMIHRLDGNLRYECLYVMSDILISALVPAIALKVRFYDGRKDGHA